MRKVTNSLFVLFLALVMLATNSCSSNSYDDSSFPQTTVLTVDTTATTVLKKNLLALNDEYSVSQTRAPKWLRWLTASIVDVVTFIIDGGVGGAAGASKVAFDMTKSEANSSLGIEASKSQFSTNEDLKAGSLEGLDVSSVGYLHNKIIIELYKKHDGKFTIFTENLLLDEVFDIEKSVTGFTNTAERITLSRGTIDRILKLHYVCKTIPEYADSAKALTDDQSKKQAIEICGIITDGLQYVDDNDTTYINKVKELIDNSKLDEKTEKLVKEGISIAVASAKLWNTDRNLRLVNK